MTDSNFDSGMKIRREVLGDSYVDNSLENATEFTFPLQQLVTEKYVFSEARQKLDGMSLERH